MLILIIPFLLAISYFLVYGRKEKMLICVAIIVGAIFDILMLFYLHVVVSGVPVSYLPYMGWDKFWCPLLLTLMLLLFGLCAFFFARKTK